MNENNTHPLNLERVAELWDEHVPLALNFQGWNWGDRNGILAAMRAAYDAGSAEWKANAEAAVERAERAEEKLAGPVHVDEDARPWEPLGQDEPLNVGDEVRRDYRGITTTAVVASVDEDGEPWTDEGALIGLRLCGTWHVRRAAPTLPTEDGAVIVPAEGHEFIETSTGLGCYVMIHTGHGRWRGGAEIVAPEDITPGTWRAA